VFGDERGFFFESFNHRQFEQAIGRSVEFVQDNHSKSIKHVLRGLHFQTQQPQGKLVRVVQGDVFDVAVDLRRDSPTFGQWAGAHLSAETNTSFGCPRALRMVLWCSLTPPNSCTKPRTTTPHNSRLRFAGDDPDIGIEWPFEGEPILSAKDAAAMSFKDYAASLK